MTSEGAVSDEWFSERVNALYKKKVRVRRGAHWCIIKYVSKGIHVVLIVGRISYYIYNIHNISYMIMIALQPLVVFDFGFFLSFLFLSFLSSPISTYLHISLKFEFTTIIYWFLGCLIMLQLVSTCITHSSSDILVCYWRSFSITPLVPDLFFFFVLIFLIQHH